MPQYNIIKDFENVNQENSKVMKRRKKNLWVEKKTSVKAIGQIKQKQTAGKRTEEKIAELKLLSHSC